MSCHDVTGCTCFWLLCVVGLTAVAGVVAAWRPQTTSRPHLHILNSRSRCNMLRRPISSAMQCPCNPCRPCVRKHRLAGRCGADRNSTAACLQHTAHMTAAPVPHCMFVEFGFPRLCLTSLIAAERKHSQLSPGSSESPEGSTQEHQCAPQRAGQSLAIHPLLLRLVARPRGHRTATLVHSSRSPLSCRWRGD